MLGQMQQDGKGGKLILVMISRLVQQSAQAVRTLPLQLRQLPQDQADLGHQVNGEAVGFRPGRISQIIRQPQQPGQALCPADQCPDSGLLPIRHQQRKLHFDGQQHGDTRSVPADQTAGPEPVHARLQLRVIHQPAMELHRDGLDTGGMECPVKCRRRVILNFLPDQGQGIFQAGVPFVAPVDLLHRIPAIQQGPQTHQALPGLGGRQHDGQGMALHLPDQPPQMGQLPPVHIAIDVSKQLHAVHAPEFRLVQLLCILSAAVQGRQVHPPAQLGRQIILRREHQGKAPVPQLQQPPGQLPPFRPDAPPDILKIVKIHAGTVPRDGPEQEGSRVRRLVGGDLQSEALCHGGVELQVGFGTGAVHHGHPEAGIFPGQLPDDLPADLGLADARHAGDPPRFGRRPGIMGTQLLHHLVTAHQGIDRRIRLNFLPQSAVGGKPGEEGREGFVMLSGGIPDGPDAQLPQFFPTAGKFCLLLRSGKQGIVASDFAARPQDRTGPVLVQTAPQKQHGPPVHLLRQKLGHGLRQVRSSGVCAVTIVVGRPGQYQLLIIFNITVELDEQIFMRKPRPVCPGPLKIISRVDASRDPIEILQAAVKIGGQHQAPEQLRQPFLVGGAASPPLRDLPGIEGIPENVEPRISARLRHYLRRLVIIPGCQMRFHRFCHIKFRPMAAQQLVPHGILHPGRQSRTDHRDQIAPLRMLQYLVIHSPVAIVFAPVPAIHQFLKGHGISLPHGHFSHYTVLFDNIKGLHTKNPFSSALLQHRDV